MMFAVIITCFSPKGEGESAGGTPLQILHYEKDVLKNTESKPDEKQEEEEKSMPASRYNELSIFFHGQKLGICIICFVFVF